MTGEEKGWTIFGVMCALALIVITVAIMLHVNLASDNNARVDRARAHACEVREATPQAIGQCILVAGR